ncbi:MAG: SDR family oxidoreductase [Actinomycetes bacterium]
MDRNADLTGRVALVTGASRGLGAATARNLAQHGCDVVLTYRKRAEEAEAVADAVRATGRRAWLHRVELGEEESVDALIAAIRDEPGRIDILVANAAATSFRSLLDAERRHVERTFAISVTAFLQLVQGVVPLMGESGGRIVAVSGADTRTWIPGHGLLAAAKAAMESMVQYLACELAPRGTTVVGISPGWLDGDSIQMMLGPFYETAMAAERETHPMRQTVSPDEAADTIAMLCGDAARWLNGSTVEADGAGIFALLGRYSVMGAKVALAQRPDLDAGDAPAVPL